MGDETSADRVLVHGRQFFFLLFLRVDFERTILRLPETVAFPEFKSARRDVGSIPLSDFKTAHAFPAMVS